MADRPFPQKSPRKKKPVKPLRERGQRARSEALAILNGPRLGSQTPLYDSDYHPAHLLKFFQEQHARVEEILEVETKQFDVKFVQKPIPVPTISGWAANVGISKCTFTKWRVDHPEFEDSVGVVKAIQEDILLRMGTLGAYNPRVVEFMLKNLHEWTDRLDVKQTGDVHLHFDEQDKGSL